MALILWKRYIWTEKFPDSHIFEKDKEKVLVLGFMSQVPTKARTWLRLELEIQFSFRMWMEGIQLREPSPGLG